MSKAYIIHYLYIPHPDFNHVLDDAFEDLDDARHHMLVAAEKTLDNYASDELDTDFQMIVSWQVDPDCHEQSVTLQRLNGSTVEKWFVQRINLNRHM